MLCVQLISSSYNIKTIPMYPIPVRELSKHKIQKNKSHVFCRAANVYSVGPKTKVQEYLLVPSPIWSRSNHHNTRILKLPYQGINYLIRRVAYIHGSQTIRQATPYLVHVYYFIPPHSSPKRKF